MIKIITTALLIMALTTAAAAAVFAHEDREDGDYKFIVGFLREPAYEGERNAVSVRVAKVIHQEDDKAGDHSHSTNTDLNAIGAVFASQTLSGGKTFEFEVPNTLAGMSVPFHSSLNKDTTGMITVEDRNHDPASHDMDSKHSGMDHGPMESEKRISVNITADADMGGVNVHLATNGWKWTPESVNLDHAPSEGHAHIYVDGEKVGRIYGAYHYLSGLAPGERHIRVTLNSNNHKDLLFEGQPVEAMTTVTAPVPVHMHDHDHPIEAESPMSLQAAAHPDTGKVYNIRLIPSGFTFSPQNVNGDHVEGEGHAHLYIDGEKITRMYGPWLHLPDLEPGTHTVRVTLNTNDHKAYYWDGEPVEASIVVHVEADGDARHTPERVIVNIHGDAFDPADVSVNPGSTIVFVNHSAADLSVVSGIAAGGMMTESGGGLHKEKTGPVEGLHDTLQVEVTHVPSGASRIMPLRAVFGDPGHYQADLIPTSPGHYRFRFFGAIEGNPVDETFDSEAGGGDFDDVQSASVIHFPETVASAREVEGAVRGAQATAQEAQREAMNASDSVSGAFTIGIIGIIVGAIGTALGGGAIFVSMRRGN